MKTYMDTLAENGMKCDLSGCSGHCSKCALRFAGSLCHGPCCHCGGPPKPKSLMEIAMEHGYVPPAKAD